MAFIRPMTPHLADMAALVRSLSTVLLLQCIEKQQFCMKLGMHWEIAEQVIWSVLIILCLYLMQIYAIAQTTLVILLMIQLLIALPLKKRFEPLKTKDLHNSW